MRVYWLEQGLADLPADDDWLTAGESARLAALHIPKRRADWRLGRWTAKRAVLAYVALAREAHRGAGRLCLADVGHNDIEIHPASCGAPEVVVSGVPASPTISLSHSNGVAVCAVATSGVSLGCDLELIEPRSAAFIADYFTAEEQALVAHSPATARDRIITLLWSAKESSLKALHTGLRLDTRDVVVTPDLENGGDWRPLQVRCASGGAFSGWWCERGNSIVTLVAAPAPSPPTVLDAIRRYAHTRA